MKTVLLSIFIAFATCVVSYSQNTSRAITGSVWILPEGETVAERVCGATVKQLGTNNVTSTDYDGIFRMTITNEDIHHTLRASFFGYYSQDKETKSNREYFNNFIFILLEDTVELNNAISKEDDER